MTSTRTPRLLALLAFAAAAPLSAQAGTYDLTEFVRTGDAVPGGTGTFLSIAGHVEPPSTLVGEVLFAGQGSDGEVGLYKGVQIALAKRPTAVELVADNTTPVPGGQGTFTGFGSAALGGTDVVFQAATSLVPEGVYIVEPPTTIRLVADTGTPIPGGQGNFTVFAGVAFDGTTVVCRASGPGGQEGVYIVEPPVAIVADLATPIPGGQLGPFTGFSPDVFVDQGVVAFGGNGPQGYSGFFLDGGNGLVTLVDTFTPVPGALGENFSGFEEASFAQGAVAFHGFGANGAEGIFIAEGVGPPCLVACRIDSIPGGPGTYAGFEGVSFDGTHIAFVGLGSKVLLSDMGGTLEPVVAVGDVIGNRVVADLAIGPGALNGNEIAFWASFTDGSESVYTATYTDPTGVPAPAPAAAFRAQAAPNPFARDTEIRFTAPAGGKVMLEVFDVAGRRVAQQRAGIGAVGPGRIRVDGAELPRGVYFYRLTAGAETVTGRMVKAEAH